MNMARKNPGRIARTVLTVTAVLAASAGLSGCGGGSETKENIAAIDIVPQKVERVVFTDGKVSTEIRRIDGDWLPGKGGTVESLAILDAAEERLFPVNAYRIIDTARDRVDQHDPNYGLDKASGRSIDVFDNSGKDWRLTVGKPTFNQAGYYAKVDGDPRVFLIIAKTVSDIISIANGKVFEFDPIDKIKFVDKYFDQAAHEGGKDDLPDLDPWLTQTLASRSGDMAKLHEAARKSSSIIGPPDKGKVTGEGAPDGPLPGSNMDLSRSAVAGGTP